MSAIAKQTPIQFFYEHAGYGFVPGKETPEQGRKRGARALAAAEAKASHNGWSFDWSEDHDADRSGIDHMDALWQCVCRDSDGRILSSLNSIDFGEQGSPWNDPYRRVVQAELALEAAVYA